MSNIGLFATGSVVTLLVAGSIWLLVWGAILDGRYEDERQAAERDAVDPNSVGVAGSGRLVPESADARRTFEVLAPTTAAAGGVALAGNAVVLPDEAVRPLPAVVLATSEAGAEQRVRSR